MLAASQQIRFCTAPDGVRLAYATVGKGPPLVRAASMYIHLMPVFGAVLATAVLGERIAAFHVPGAALVFAGLAIANRRPAGR